MGDRVDSPEDLIHKQKLFEALESVAPHARAITSSSSGLDAKDRAARCRRPDRCLVAHALNPPELIPLVELVPSEYTDGALVEVLKGWLRALGRIPVTIKKPIPGRVAGRISAAVWREAIDQEQRHRLVHAVQRTYEGEIEQIRSARDRRLAAILRAMEEARISGALAQPRTLPDSSSPGEE